MRNSAKWRRYISFDFSLHCQVLMEVYQSDHLQLSRSDKTNFFFSPLIFVQHTGSMILGRNKIREEKRYYKKIYKFNQVHYIPLTYKVRLDVKLKYVCFYFTLLFLSNQKKK